MASVALSTVRSAARRGLIRCVEVQEEHQKMKPYPAPWGKPLIVTGFGFACGL
jgi:hypothetical protein